MTSCLGSRLALPHIRFEKLRMDADVFLNTEKISRFSKIPGYVWMVKYDSKTLRVDADFFKYEGKISVFENTRLRMDEVSLQVGNLNGGWTSENNFKS